ncbi:basic salivary proline-rich protein 3-like [Austrofundulus limnaeus]|uniref:Basic salivary proline-rich protein 3-like n=1 Tax=Austrofundulus limnaeus TaxID=52670 RepID=A0A2I4BWJ3_AUSLI|nr:PREDICTED: basic salivary proline-rich protein 3-like [Austrofundulus limnaeus]
MNTEAPGRTTPRPRPDRARGPRPHKAVTGLSQYTPKCPAPDTEGYQRTSGQRHSPPEGRVAGGQSPPPEVGPQVNQRRGQPKTQPDTYPIKHRHNLTLIFIPTHSKTHKMDAILQSCSPYIPHTPLVQDIHPPPTEGSPHPEQGGRHIHSGVERSRQPRSGPDRTRPTGQSPPPQRIHTPTTPTHCERPSAYPQPTTQWTLPPGQRANHSNQEPYLGSPNGPREAGAPALSPAHPPRPRAHPQPRLPPDGLPLLWTPSVNGYRGTWE